MVLSLAKQLSANAKRLVRKDTGNLARSIEVEQQNRDRATVYTDAAYAKAQEYGIPGTAYGFTPYMRPAAIALRTVMGRLGARIFKKFYSRMSLRRE
jgi:hypothetical protein